MWFAIAVLSMLCYGIQSFLLKMADEKGCDKEITILSFFLTVGTIAAILYLLFGHETEDLSYLVIFGIIQATFALAAYVLRLEALDRIPSVVAFPLFGLSTFFAALLGIAMLGENVIFSQAIGIVLALTAILVLIEENHFHLKSGITIALISSFFMASSSIILKIAAPNVNLFLFMAVSCFYAAFPLYFLEKTRKKSVGRKVGAIKMGAVIGVVNFAAFYLLLKALLTADAAQVYPVVGLSLVVAIILSEFVYKEKLTRSRLASAALAAIAIIFLGLGA